MEVSYDDEADVLYITLRECGNSENVHQDNGVIVSKDRETGEIVGYTVMYFSEKEGVDLPAAQDIDTSMPA